MNEMNQAKPAIIAAALALLWMLETVVPQFTGRSRRLSHYGHNLALGLLNVALVSLVFATALVASAEWSAARGLGLLHRIDAPAWVAWPLAILLLDLWMYLWHRLNHKVPLLWRLHSVHHSDAELDASSASRFHTGEIVLSSLARLAVLPLLGVTPAQLLLYELILQPVILFHHSNVRLPARLDQALRTVIVTPWMHWVHHSRYRPETDSNFASVFSFWDRLFGSFRLREDPSGISLGLDGYEPQEWRTIAGMLRSPFRARRVAPPK